MKINLIKLSYLVLPLFTSRAFANQSCTNTDVSGSIDSSNVSLTVQSARLQEDSQLGRFWQNKGDDGIA